MGLMICEVHGKVGVALVTPVIGSAMMENRNPDSICSVRYTELSDDDISECWSDKPTVDRFHVPIDRVMSLEELERFKEFFRILVPVCSKCFGKWLEAQR